MLPFGARILAHLRAQQTKRSPQQRMQAKLQLIRLLLEHGYSKKQIGQLFRFLDWVLTLPMEQEVEFQKVIEEETEMKRYVTSFERIAMEKGKLEGKLEGELSALRAALQEILHLRFVEVPNEVQEFINGVTDPERLRQLHRAAVLCSELDDFTSQLALAE